MSSGDNMLSMRTVTDRSVFVLDLDDAPDEVARLRRRVAQLEVERDALSELLMAAYRERPPDRRKEAAA